MRVLFILFTITCLLTSRASADEAPWWMKFRPRSTEQMRTDGVLRPAMRSPPVPVPVASPRHAVPASNFADTGSRTTEPIGHFEFCERNPHECPTSVSSEVVMLTQAVWDTLVAVNDHVNRTVYPLTDEQIYGKDRTEYWTVAKTRGDCEDFVLLKRKLLLERGFPLSAMLITVVRNGEEGHAVLTVRTDLGDFILDNLAAKVTLWSKTRYTFLKRQSGNSTRRWVMIMRPDHNTRTSSLRDSQFDYRNEQ